MVALKRVEAGLPVPDICRELGISTATFYKWRAKFGGMDTAMMARLKELEEENRRLKKLDENGDFGRTLKTGDFSVSAAAAICSFTFKNIA